MAARIENAVLAAAFTCCGAATGFGTVVPTAIYFSVAFSTGFFRARKIAPWHYTGMRTLFAILFLLLFTWALPAGTLTKSHSTGKFSDAEIEATIKSKLAKSKIGKEGFQVHVKDGVATWTGTTKVMQHKGAATRMAKTAGAIRVLNNIKVSEQDAAKSTGNLTGAPRHVSLTPAAKPAN
jgi:BON domain-containing protein